MTAPIIINSTTGVNFELLDANAWRFLVKRPGSDFVYMIYHQCACVQRQIGDSCVRDEIAEIVHGLGIITAAELKRAWDAVTNNVTFFSVLIVENVGDMEFSTKRFCVARSREKLFNRLDKEMSSYRGEAINNTDTDWEDTWDYGKSTARIECVHEENREAVKEALKHGLISLWLWVN